MPDPTQVTGIEGSTAAIAALLDPAGNIQEPQERQEPSPEEGTLPANPTDEETAEAQPEGEAEAGPEEEAAASEEGAEEAPPELPQTVTVKVDGQAITVPLEEAIAGYQRHAAFSQRTAELAERRKAFESTEQAVKQERATYAQLIPALRQRLESSLPQKPDQSLIDSDPVKYVRDKAAYDEHLEQLQAAQFEENRVRTAQTQEQQEALKGRLTEARDKLVEAVPIWKDTARYEADRPKIREYAKKLGFSDDEISQTADARAVVALYDGMRFRQLMAQKLRPVVNNGIKPAPVGSASPSRTSSTFTRDKQRLAQTGRPTDAMAAIKGLL